MAQANLSEAARLQNKRKMDIAYTITKWDLIVSLKLLTELAIAMTVYNHIIHCNYQCKNAFNNCNILL